MFVLSEQEIRRVSVNLKKYIFKKNTWTSLSAAKPFHSFLQLCFLGFNFMTQKAFRPSNLSRSVKSYRWKMRPKKDESEKAQVTLC